MVVPFAKIPGGFLGTTRYQAALAERVRSRAPRAIDVATHVPWTIALRPDSERWTPLPCFEKKGTSFRTRPVQGETAEYVNICSRAR